ncbi:hypothetical protein B5M09_009371 [Aphanomyces astaci]|uniref:CHCH domain-containing protein n=2 Tax=Aphanomyces astaci TaxID=112090 RepID=A0A425CUA8_APHAT|nr:hypothetical protein B5M09_009371 [Aphanomyces astaci]
MDLTPLRSFLHSAETTHITMARSRSSSSPRRSAPAAKPAARPAPAPAPVHAAPAPAPMQQQSGGMMSGLLGTVASGMAFGTGSAIAHRAVGAVANSFGGSSDEAHHETPAAVPAAAAPAQNACSNDHKAFMDCLNANQNNVSSCQYYFDQYNRCNNNGQSSFSAN